MNEQTIATVYVVIEDTLKAMGQDSDRRAWVSAAEVLTVAVLATQYFQNHHERTLCSLKASGYLPRALSISRFNRRIHRLSGWRLMLLESVCVGNAGRSVYHRQYAAAGVSALSSGTLPKSRGTRLWWVLRRQKREVLRLSLASGLSDRGRPCLATCSA